MDPYENYGSPGDCKQCLKSSINVKKMRDILAHSEEVNEALIQENENLHKITSDFRKKEKKWTLKEREFEEREQSLNEKLNMLNEQKFKTDEEIIKLRQLLARSKTEAEKIISQNDHLNRELKKKEMIEKDASEFKQKYLQAKTELLFQGAALQEAEEARDRFMMHIETLQLEIDKKDKQCSELMSKTSNSLNIQSEILNSSDVDFDASCVSTSTNKYLSHNTLPLKNELDSCFDIYPLSCQTINQFSQTDTCLCIKCLNLNFCEAESQTDLDTTSSILPTYFCSTYKMQVVSVVDAAVQANLENLPCADLPQLLTQTDHMQINEESDFSCSSKPASLFDSIDYAKLQNNIIGRRQDKKMSLKLKTILMFCFLVLFIFVMYSLQVYKEIQVNGHYCKNAFIWSSISKLFEVKYLYPNGPPPH